MQIGQIIRKYRKSKNMTQEEMADRLGVSAPAVNKWENGNSLPDIMLLAPSARLLSISLDTLLSFQEELTEEEIKHILNEANTRLKEEPYEKAFEWARGKLEQYPNCEQLMLNVAAMFDGFRLVVKEVKESEKYDVQINAWYSRALKSKEEDIRTRAADCLFSYYIRKEQYEKAEEYIKYFSVQSPERKRKQAVIYDRTGKRDEAYKTYEELLFSEYQMVSCFLHGIYMLALKDNDIKKAHMLVDKQVKLAKLFEMGKYHEASAELELATLEKDTERVIDTAEKMLSGIEQIGDFSKSPLYEHMTFQKTSELFMEELKNNLLKNFREEESYDFLKEDSRWQELIR